MQLYDPRVFLQVALASHLWLPSEHSSMSEMIKIFKISPQDVQIHNLKTLNADVCMYAHFLPLTLYGKDLRSFTEENDFT